MELSLFLQVWCCRFTVASSKYGKSTGSSYTDLFFLSNNWYHKYFRSTRVVDWTIKHAIYWIVVRKFTPWCSSVLLSFLFRSFPSHLLSVPTDTLVPCCFLPGVQDYPVTPGYFMLYRGLKANPLCTYVIRTCPRCTWYLRNSHFSRESLVLSSRLNRCYLAIRMDSQRTSVYQYTRTDPRCD